MQRGSWPLFPFSDCSHLPSTEHFSLSPLSWHHSWAPRIQGCCPIFCYILKVGHIFFNKLNAWVKERDEVKSLKYTFFKAGMQRRRTIFHLSLVLPWTWGSLQLQGREKLWKCLIFEERELYHPFLRRAFWIVSLRNPYPLLCWQSSESAAPSQSQRPIAMNLSDSLNYISR